jgi:hypothetical protein
VKGKQALDALERYKGARNAGKTPILEGGMDYKQLGMSNQDAEWLASRRFTIEDIARMFNVSPIFLQEYSNSTYSNFSEASRAFLTMTMRPWLANFEQQIKSALLVASPVPGIRYQVEFDSADLLRATPTERYATYERGIKNGIMNPNEAREREGMPPREGGDEFSQAWKQEVKISKDGKEVTHESRRTEKPRHYPVFTTTEPSGQVIQEWEDGAIWAEVKGISGRELVALVLRLPKHMSCLGAFPPRYYRANRV